jgi:hypothetical protein
MKKPPISVIMVIAAVLATATATGLLTALSMSETALAQGGGDTCFDFDPGCSGDPTGGGGGGSGSSHCGPDDPEEFCRSGGGGGGSGSCLPP